MAKTKTASVSKSESKKSNATKNIAAGGQVYDRTTGTWLGETKGSIGDGKNHHQGGTTKVWTDANGVVGVQQLTTPVLQKAGSAGTGPGRSGLGTSRTVGTGAPTVGRPVGRGPGNSGVTTGPLTPVLDDEVTSIMIGGDWYKSNPWFSDVGKAWSDRLGEPGEWLGALVTIPADLAWTSIKGAEWAASESPNWNGAIPSPFVEAQPRYHDGWVTYDEGDSWEKAPTNSPAGEARNWSF